MSKRRGEEVVRSWMSLYMRECWEVVIGGCRIAKCERWARAGDDDCANGSVQCDSESTLVVNIYTPCRGKQVGQHKVGRHESVGEASPHPAGVAEDVPIPAPALRVRSRRHLPSFDALSPGAEGRRAPLPAREVHAAEPHRGVDPECFLN
ncbi:hypothetical protein CALVIDRAFT_256643 [Calocera viscosa TUFC12733]|uniref:Uncharacterized protein n=1 Tax=Calocera viscosa (strain TUFC12733) TaxID=1330018 RepID=A0A167J8T7_CALVF|nr:hypothetical protein CALVIDRAFT_256643 [Calocera viscosa TUFC12733]